MVSSINNYQSCPNYVNFEGRKKGINSKKVRKAFKELPYTLGIKKKKTLWEKIGDFFAPKKKNPVKSLKKNGKNVLVETPKRDNLFTFWGKDMSERMKKMDEILFD